MSKAFTLNALKTATGILAGRLSGLAREVLLAYFFGTSALIGYFKYAFSLPNLARRILGEGALNNAFIPILADKKQSSDEAASEFSSRILSTFALFNTALSAIAILILFGTSFFLSEEQLAIVHLGSLMMPYLPLICLAGIAAGILNLLNSYSLPSLMSTSLNFCLIAACLISAALDHKPEQMVYAMAIGLLLSGVLQMTILLHAIIKKGFKLRWLPTSPKHPDMQLLWVTFIPAVIGASAQQISTFLDKTIALAIAEEAVSSISYSELLIYLPVGVFGVALSTVCLPAMSSALSAKDSSSLQKTFDNALKQAFFLALPCTFIYYLFGEQLLSLLYLRGNFTDESLQNTLKAFIWYPPGIPFFTATKIILPVFYAQKNTKTPFKISLICIAVNLCLGLSLIPWLSYGSLALATSISSALNFTLLCYFSKKLSYLTISKSLIKNIGLQLFCNLLSMLSLLYLSPYLRDACFWTDSNFINLLCFIVAGLSLYCLALMILTSLLGINTIKSFLKR